MKPLLFFIWIRESLGIGFIYDALFFCNIVGAIAVMECRFWLSPSDFSQSNVIQVDIENYWQGNKNI